VFHLLRHPQSLLPPHETHLSRWRFPYNALMPVLPASILHALAGHASQADSDPTWPIASLTLLNSTDAYRWSIPRAFGGADWATADLLTAYESLAASCLTTAFILSQRDAAIRRIVGFAPPAFKEQTLPRLATGEWFTTIGLSQLTTSRQHVQPSLLITETSSDKFVLNGEVPWVTGADRAEFMVIGAKDRAHQQYLFALPAKHPGMTIDPPMQLMALAGSRTTRVRLDAVVLGSEHLLIGPVSEIPTLGRGGTGGLETSCLALGLSRAAVEYLEAESKSRPELVPVAQQLATQLTLLRRDMHALAEGQAAMDAATLRAASTQLVLAATQIALVAAKGAGYVRGHPVERWARQALFFCVWSCPRPVQVQVIEAQLNLLCDSSI
jgi:butyryl-CoA dehydrogenase